MVLLDLLKLDDYTRLNVNLPNFFDGLVKIVSENHFLFALSSILNVSLCNGMYTSVEWPSEFHCSETVAIPKKQGTEKCQEHRPISLLPHTAKILLRIINRSRGREHTGGAVAYGFWRGMGSRDSIGVVRSKLGKVHGKRP